MTTESNRPRRLQWSIVAIAALYAAMSNLGTTMPRLAGGVVGFTTLTVGAIWVYNGWSDAPA